MNNAISNVNETEPQVSALTKQVNIPTDHVNALYVELDQTRANRDTANHRSLEEPFQSSV